MEIVFTKNKPASEQETVIEENGRSFAVGSECIGTCGKVFKAFGVAVPPTIREP